MWKSLARRRYLNRKKRQRLFLYWFIALILISAAFVNGAKLISKSVSSFSSTLGPKLTFEKFEGEKIAGVVIADPLILVTFDPVDKSVNFFEMPENFYLEVGKRGFFLADKVHELDKADGAGGKLLAETITANFAIPVDFYLNFKNIKIDREKIFWWRDHLTQPPSLFWFFQIIGLREIMETNFTKIDGIKLLWQLKKIRKDKIDYQVMSKENFEEVILPNGDRVLKVAQEGLTPQTLEQFHDLKIAQEGLTIGVYNAAGAAGLAQLIAKICQNLGAATVVGGDAQQTLAISKIQVKEGLSNTATVKRLIKTFGLKLEKQAEVGFADIVILAGEDLAKYGF